MKELGYKMSEMYPSASDGDAKQYPSVRLPLSVLGDMKAEIGKHHDLKFKGKLTQADETHGHFELTHGEASEPASEEKKETYKQEKEETTLGKS